MASPLDVQAPRRPAVDHAYLRLAANRSFLALWLSQVISALGDRVHQIALVFLVANASGGSPFALGLIFAAVTLPACVVGPVAGTLVDRWDRKRTMIGSDLLRAGLVVVIPFASGINLGLVVVLVLMLSSASTFFRPARTAVLPQIVPDRDLLTANSALWIADTVTDLVGYGLGGIFVALLGSSLALAFWVDGASYLFSALLLTAVAVPAILTGVRRTSSSSASALVGELLSGWRFLRNEAVLFALTVQAAIAEYGLGALTPLSPLLIAALPLAGMEAPAAYGLFEMALGIGLVAGGVIVGAMATRLPKGLTIVLAFAAFGVTLMALSVSHSLMPVLILAAAAGLANVAFVVPSQTVFQMRTPPELMGRVVAIRIAVVNAVLVIAMVTSGALAESIGWQPVLALSGALTVTAGLAGLLSRSVRGA